MAKILLIENMKGVRRALASLLRTHGHETIEVESGLQGIEYLQNTHFDLVITEVLMTDADGSEVLAFLETQAIRPPVIAISGGNSEIPAEMALLMVKTQATATLKKPVNENDLMELVQKILKA